MRNKKFLRSMFLSLIIFFNIFLLCIGICKVYVNMQLVNFGKYVNAIEINDKEIKILDFIIKY